MPSRMLLGTGLGDEVLLGAGQARKPVQHRTSGLCAMGLGRQVNPKAHLTLQTAGPMLPDLLATAKAGMLLKAFHGAQSRPLLLATWVEMASMSAGDRQS